MIYYKKNNPKKPFKEISYSDMEKKVINTGFHYGGIMSLNGESSEVIHKTFIPPYYKRFSSKMRGRGIEEDGNDHLYYPLGRYNLYPQFQLSLLSQSSFLAAATEATADAARGKGHFTQAENEADAEAFDKWLKSIGAGMDFEEQLFNSMGFFFGAYVEFVFGDEIEKNEDGLTTDVNQVLKKVKVGDYAYYRVGVKDDLNRITDFWFDPNFYENGDEGRRLRASRARKRDRAKNKGRDTGRTHKIDTLRAIKPLPDISDMNFEKMAEEVTVHHKDRETPYYEKDLEKYGKGRYIYSIYKPSLTSEVYPRAAWEKESTINALMLDVFLPQFDVASMENGLSVGHIVSIPLTKPIQGDEEEELAYETKKKQIRRDIRQKFQGVENADNILVLYTDPESQGDQITISEVPHNNSAETLTEKDERKERVLLSTFRCTHPALLGIPARSGKGLNHQTGTMNEADDLWYRNYVIKHTLRAEMFYNDVLIPIYEKINGKPVPGLKVTFPRNNRFKYTPSDQMMLATMTTQQIWNHFDLGIYSEEKKRELISDLTDRAIALSAGDIKVKEVGVDAQKEAKEKKEKEKADQDKLNQNDVDPEEEEDNEE